MLMRVLVTAIAAILGGCDADTNESVRVIVLDDWWNVDYAKITCEAANNWLKDNRSLINQIGCDSVTSCPELMPRITSCTIHDPSQEVRSFEDELATHLGANSQCAGVSIARYDGPNAPSNRAVTAASRKPHWDLSIDFIPGAKTQAWSMLHSVSRVFTKGDGDPKDIARDVCSLANGRGAKILN